MALKKTLLELVQDIPKSTQWARDNKDRVAEADRLNKGTLKGKLVSLITQSRYRVKKSGLEHSIDSKFLMGLYSKQGGKCALSGIVMTTRGERGGDEYWKSISLDRIDSSKGYTEDNVQLVCTGVNYMKKDMSDELFVHFCKTVVENQRGS